MPDKRVRHTRVTAAPIPQDSHTISGCLHVFSPGESDDPESSAQPPIYLARSSHKTTTHGSGTLAFDGFVLAVPTRDADILAGPDVDPSLDPALYPTLRFYLVSSGVAETISWPLDRYDTHTASLHDRSFCDLIRERIKRDHNETAGVHYSLFNVAGGYSIDYRVPEALLEHPTSALLCPRRPCFALVLQFRGVSYTVLKLSIISDRPMFGASVNMEVC